MFVPFSLEEGPKRVTSFANRRIVFVERFAVVEHETEIIAVFFFRIVTVELDKKDFMKIRCGRNIRERFRGQNSSGRQVNGTKSIIKAIFISESIRDSNPAICSTRKHTSLKLFTVRSVLPLLIGRTDN